MYREDEESLEIAWEKHERAIYSGARRSAAETLGWWGSEKEESRNDPGVAVALSIGGRRNESAGCREGGERGRPASEGGVAAYQPAGRGPKRGRGRVAAGGGGGVD